jgi:hypothetical protein
MSQNKGIIRVKLQPVYKTEQSKYWTVFRTAHITKQNISISVHSVQCYPFCSQSVTTRNPRQFIKCISQLISLLKRTHKTHKPFWRHSAYLRITQSSTFCPAEGLWHATSTAVCCTARPPTLYPQLRRLTCCCTPSHLHQWHYYVTVFPLIMS